MIAVVCPYCEYGIGVLFDNCMDELTHNNKTICTCTSCKKEFIAYYGKDKIQSKKKGPEMKAIVAVDRNWAIGKNNQLLFHIPEDMKFFKNTTTNHTVLMGRKTYESIGKALPNRNNLILTRNKHFTITNGNFDSKYVIAIMNNDLFERYYSTLDDIVFVIGGESVYKQYIDRCSEIYVTIVDAEIKDADAFFPDLNKTDFKLSEVITEKEFNGLKFKITKWKK